MNTLEQIKHDYEQTHYRKQRELIDDGKLDYWGLSRENRRGIATQCRDEVRMYPELRWEGSNLNGVREGKGATWDFDGTCYYRRLDPLPEEQEANAGRKEIEELKRQIAAKDEEIEIIEYNLEAQRIELENQVERNQDQMEEIKRLRQCAEYDNQDAERQANLIANYRKEQASLYRDIRTLAMHITNQ